MPSSSAPRITRKHPGNKCFTKATLRDKAFPLLMEDFVGRCAYSLMSVRSEAESCMEIDHHNPKLKGRRKHAYSNLFPACRVCNLAKSDTWPDKEMLRKGFRFLNPCKEMDYRHQIFEDPDTHKLVGTTRAARWHIRKLSLNCSKFVIERQRRSWFIMSINSSANTLWRATLGEEQEALARSRAMSDMLETFIPEIPPPP